MTGRDLDDLLVALFFAATFVAGLVLLLVTSPVPGVG